MSILAKVIDFVSGSSSSPVRLNGTKIKPSALT